MADVFVSYARSDKARVAPLVAAIEAQGWSVWWDPAIEAGQQFDDQIDTQLQEALAVVVVWTPTSVSSRWVRGEARDAAERGILVPVRFEDARLPIDARAIQTTDLDKWDEDPASPEFQELLRSLAAVIKRQRARQPARPGTGTAAAAGAPATRVAVCVLPFVNMSGDQEQEYFSDGITEDIITDLSKVSALAVVSRNSAFQYKGKNVDILKLARELKVGHVLEGSVRKAGGRVRITAQLVDGASNGHVWAERYDRDLNDIFALQAEISEAIVRALRLKLLPEEKKAIEQRGTDSVDAYNLYLMARQSYITGHEGDARRVEAIVRLSKRATEIDPRYSRAWALLAIGQMNLRFVHGRKGDDGLEAAARALALDANLAEAHAVKARILAQHGRHDEAAAEIEIALRLDSESYEVNRAAAYLAFRRQRLDEAIRYYEKSMSLMETDLNSGGMLGTCYLAVGDLQASRRVAQLNLSRTEKVLAQDPNNGAAMAYGANALACLGEAERAKEWMKRALLIEPENMNARYNFACVLATYLKDPEAALELLGPVFETLAIGFLNHANADPDLDSLRDNPRFKAMVAGAKARLAAGDEAGVSAPS
ncbi:MAG: TIR domain-containing protein [Gammaproteobacteria bacterium]|nr:TIR domain-containing protein [Gammaproteobacteria bacterium]MBV9696409.1 TIR domain-containing protein [Gammaproteobacteria bacterium]